MKCDICSVYEATIRANITAGLDDHIQYMCVKCAGILEQEIEKPYSPTGPNYLVKAVFDTPTKLLSLIKEIDDQIKTLEEHYKDIEYYKDVEDWHYYRGQIRGLKTALHTIYEWEVKNETH